MITTIRQVFRDWRMRRSVRRWERVGRPAPPPHLIKQAAIRRYIDLFGLKVFVETGTFRGDMVDAMKSDFDRLYSIELSRELFERARHRFRSYDNVKLIHGDSGVQIARVLTEIDEPTLFWLDGHYSAGETARGEQDTPIMQELQHIFDAPDYGHVVIIDDARCFGENPAYPSIDDLRNFVGTQRTGLEFTIADDSIRITPPEVAGKLPLKNIA